MATTLSNANSYTDTVATTTLSQANAYTDAAVGNIVNSANQYTDQQVAKVSKEAAQGTALAIALSTPLDFSNGSNAMAIGTGFYKGQSALSVVGGKRLDNLTYTAGVAKTGSEHAVKLSLGISW